MCGQEVFVLKYEKGVYPYQIARIKLILCALGMYGNMLLGVTEYRVEPSSFYVFTS